MKRTDDEKPKLEVIDDPDKVGRGLLPLPQSQIQERLGMDKWAHRDKNDFKVLGGGDSNELEVTDEFINSVVNQPGDVEPWD